MLFNLFSYNFGMEPKKKVAHDQGALSIKRGTVGFTFDFWNQFPSLKLRCYRKGVSLRRTCIDIIVVLVSESTLLL